MREDDINILTYFSEFRDYQEGLGRSEADELCFVMFGRKAISEFSFLN